MELTRRKLAVSVLGPAAAMAAVPQAAAQEEPLVKAAHDRNQANFAAAAKVELPMATEPSFQFKA